MDSILDIKIKKRCIFCGNFFETYFPLRMECNGCIIKSSEILKKYKDVNILDNIELKIWDNNDK